MHLILITHTFPWTTATLAGSKLETLSLTRDHPPRRHTMPQILPDLYLSLFSPAASWLIQSDHVLMDDPKQSGAAFRRISWYLCQGYPSLFLEERPVSFVRGLISFPYAPLCDLSSQFLTKIAKLRKDRLLFEICYWRLQRAYDCSVSAWVDLQHFGSINCLRISLIH